jgi:hypothetical protein
LLWLGSQRQTVDIDFTLLTVSVEALRQTVAAVADELALDVEEFAPAEFMPLPTGFETRHQFIGRHGTIEAFLFDPYSMAVMKIDRAFETAWRTCSF